MLSALLLLPTTCQLCALLLLVVAHIERPARVAAAVAASIGLRIYLRAARQVHIQRAF
jgi:hypothetical protein